MSQDKDHRDVVWQRAASLHGRRETVSWKSFKQKEKKPRKKNLKNSVVFLRQGQAGEPLGYFVALENYYKAWKWEPGGGKERKATKDEQSEKRGTKSQIQRKQA